MTVVERYSDIQKISLNFRNVLKADMLVAGCHVSVVLFSDVQGVDADRQSTTQYLQKFCLKVRKAPVIKTFSMRE